MEKISYQLGGSESLPPIAVELTSLLFEARYHRETVDVELVLMDDESPRGAAELLASLEFYGCGRLSSCRKSTRGCAVIDRDVIDERLVITRPTIITGAVYFGSTLVVKAPTRVLGEMGGKAIFYGPSDWLQIYQRAKEGSR